MPKMHLSLIAATAVMLLAGCGEAGSQSDPPHDFSAKVVPEDFSMIGGDDWEGSLTYLNYGEPVQEFTIPARLSVQRTGRTINLKLTFPDEPGANSESDLEVTQNGTMLNEQKIVSREEGEDDLIIRTVSDCEDDERPARCEYFYDLSPTRIVFSKYVTLDGESDTFRRNAYDFSRPALPE